MNAFCALCDEDCMLTWDYLQMNALIYLINVRINITAYLLYIL